MPSEQRRGDHAGAVPTEKGASVVWKHTGKIGLGNQKGLVIGIFFLNVSVC